MPTPDSGMGSIFGGADPEQASNARTQRTRIIGPSAADSIYYGLDYNASERATLAKERAAQPVKKENLLYRFVGKPIVKGVSWAFRNYDEQVSIPIAELATMAVRQVVSGSDSKVKQEWAALGKSWADGDGGFFGKLNNFSNQLLAERKARPDVFFAEKVLGQMVTDPMNFLGWGIFAGAAGKAYRFGLIGKVLGPVDKAWIAGTQYVTDGAIKGTLQGARSVPGLKSLFKLNTRSIAGHRNAQLVQAVSVAGPDVWRADAVGGMDDFIAIMRTPALLRTPEQQEAAATFVSAYDNVEAYLQGKVRYVFNDKNEITGLTDAKGDDLRALWTLFEEGRSSNTLSASLGHFLELHSQMIQDSKAAQVIAERKSHRAIVQHMMMSGLTDKIAAQFQYGVLGRLNKGFAELVLGFQAYAPGNAIEDVWRSVQGGVVGVRMGDDEMFRLLVGSTQAEIPWTLRQGTTTLAAQVTGKEGEIERLVSGSKALSAAWNVAGGWGLRKSKEWGNYIRRQYMALKSIDEVNKEILPFLARGGDEATLVRDLIMHGGAGVEGLSPQSVRFMQQLATANIGAGSDTIRQLGSLVARKHMSTSAIDKEVVANLGEMSPKTRQLADSLKTGSTSVQRILNTARQMEENELDFIALTEPTNVGRSLEAVLTRISAARVSSKADLVDEVGLMMSFLQQTESTPLAALNAMLDHSDLKNPAALRSFWGKGHEAVAKILENADATKRRAVIDKIRADAATFSPNDADEIGKILNEISDHIESTQIHVDTIVAKYFGSLSGKGMSQEAIAAAKGDEGRAWRMFHTEKRDEYRSLAEATTGGQLKLGQIARSINAENFGADAQAYLDGQAVKFKDELRAAAEALRFTDAYGNRRKSIAAFRDALVRSYEEGALNPEQQEKVAKWFGTVADAVDKLTEVQRTDLYKLREKGMERAVKAYNRNFTNYDDTMVVDDIMSAIMPFWRYESRAWPTMARWAVEKPFYTRTFGPSGYFWQATDDGYIPKDIGGMQVSPIRGLLLGRLRRAFRSEYPSEYEGLLGKADSWQTTVERYGFYGGTWQTWLAETGKKAVTGRGVLADVGEDLPASMQTALSALVYGSVEADKIMATMMGNDWTDMKGYNASSFVRTANTLFPSKFKDYYENVYLVSHYGVTRDDVEADEGRQWMLMEATQNVAWRQVLSEQLSVLRYRPDGFEKMRLKLDTESARISGLSVEEVRNLRKEGKRVQDVVELSKVDLDTLRSLKEFELVGSVFEPLQTSARAQLQKLTNEYYDEVSKIREDALGEQFDDDMYLNAGILTGSMWRDAYHDRWVGVNASLTALKESAHFKNAPLDKASRQAFNERFHIESPIRSVVDDVLEAYYNIPIQTNEVTGEQDWNGFFRNKEKILSYLPSDIRPQVEEYIHKKESPGMREFREGRKFMWVYWDLQTAIPLWYNALGYSERASRYKEWAVEWDKAQAQASIAEQQGVAPVLIQRMLQRPQFKLVEKWEKEYRAMLRDASTIQRVPWADTRIPAFLNKFYSR